MAKAALFSAEGVRKGEFDLPDAVFGQTVNEALLHEAVVVHLGNQRQGTAMGKNRALVSGTNHKPFKQKGTGHARQGRSTSPLSSRGGKAFAPVPRDYTRKLNKKAKSVALASAFSLRVAGNQVLVFEDVAAATPKTKVFVSVLQTAGVVGKTLVIVGEANANLVLASRNIPNVELRRVQDVNVYDIMKAKTVILAQDAVEALVNRGAA
jgi:large subunit ribosomal protein L4